MGPFKYFRNTFMQAYVYGILLERVHTSKRDKRLQRIRSSVRSRVLGKLKKSKVIAMKTNGGPFLNSTLDGGAWLASSLDSFTPGERDPCTHWTGGWVGPISGLDALE
jgi:hypothetical protein